jgi:hypothetical protein
MRDAWICNYLRTPIGRYGGVLATLRADDLGAAPLKALLAGYSLGLLCVDRRKRSNMSALRNDPDSKPEASREPPNKRPERSAEQTQARSGEV